MTGISQLTLALGEDRSAVQADASSIATQWLHEFSRALSPTSELNWTNLFAPQSWLKDDLAFGWERSTIEGTSSIKEYVQQNGPDAALFNLRISKSHFLLPRLVEQGPLVWIESAFDFETKVGSGRGIFRLANIAVGVWSAWVVYVSLDELKAHPRKSLMSQSLFHKESKLTPDILDEESQPTVVVIGGGGAGLAVAACLQDAGVRTLVIESDQRIGDSWRRRHKSLTLHSANYIDARPLFGGPSSWPTFLTKDQFADYLEAYASVLELDVWLETRFQNATYDDITGRWTIETVSIGTEETRVLHPRHLIWAGGPFIRSKPSVFRVPGLEDFQGLFYYSSEHQDASAMPAVKGKKVVVVGSKTSAHDVCEDFVKAGAIVTMIQKSPTIVHSPEALVTIPLQPPPKGIGAEDFRLMQQSIPLPIMLQLLGQASNMMVRFDTKLIEALEKTEFVVSKCENGESFFRQGLQSRGGFYINHGASDLIASGRIKVSFCPGGVEKVAAHEIILADGRALEADIIVAATGYEPFESLLPGLLGDEVAERAVELHRSPEMMDDDSPAGLERLARGIFRPTGHPGFWVTLGNNGQTAQGAEKLALQILAVEDGLM